jgi:hypothetical protein
MHMSPRSSLRFAALGAAALTIMVAAAAPAQADPLFLLGSSTRRQRRSHHRGNSVISGQCLRHVFPNPYFRLT